MQCKHFTDQTITIPRFSYLHHINNTLLVNNGGNVTPNDDATHTLFYCSKETRCHAHQGFTLESTQYSA